VKVRISSSSSENGTMCSVLRYEFINLTAELFETSHLTEWPHSFSEGLSCNLLQEGNNRANCNRANCN